MHSTNLKTTDTDRFHLTLAGQDALDAAELKADYPVLYDAVKAMACSGNTPEDVARHARTAGASDSFARKMANTVRVLSAE